MGHLNGRSTTGARSKRTPEVIAKLLEFASTGLPIVFACKAVGISDETLANWRRHDSEFARQFEAARLESVRCRWNQILRAAEGTEENPGDWKAAAWSLERTYPSEFSRPEVQLQINNTFAPSMTTNQNVVIMAPERAKAVADRSQILEAEVDKLLGLPSKTEDTAESGEKE